MKKIIATLLLLATILVLVVATTSCGGTKYEITFDANGGPIDGSETKVVKVKEGSKITAPNAVRDGYVVSGWYATKQASSKWNFEKDVVNLYALSGDDLIIVLIAPNVLKMKCGFI